MYDLGGLELNFLHRRLIGAALSLATGGGPIGAARAAISGGGGRRPVSRAQADRDAALQDPRFLTAGATTADVLGHIRHGHIPGTTSGHQFHAKFVSGVPALASGGLPCIPPFRRDPSGKCSLFLGDQPGRDDAPVGGAVMGRYGAAYVPGSMIVDRAVCLKGDVVGDDGLCYPKKSLTNKERAWPRGRRPLLTGGEMRAISVARRAAGRFERTQKSLQKMGMIKKPSSRRIAPRQHAHAVIPGGTLKVLSETTN